MRQLTDALAEVDPMLQPSSVARKAACSSKSAAVRERVPPARIWLPVNEARPARSAGREYEPARRVSDTETSGSWRSSTK